MFAVLLFFHKYLNYEYTSKENEELYERSFLYNKQAVLETSKKIKELLEKIDALEARVPKMYPEVKFLNYLKRKRILVIVDLTIIKSDCFCNR